MRLRSLCRCTHKRLAVRPAFLRRRPARRVPLANTILRPPQPSPLVPLDQLSVGQRTRGTLPPAAAMIISAGLARYKFGGYNPGRARPIEGPPSPMPDVAYICLSCHGEAAEREAWRGGPVRPYCRIWLQVAFLTSKLLWVKGGTQTRRDR